MPRFNEPIEPMTLGNMRQLGVRSLDVSCWQCHHQAVLSADRWPDDVAVPTLGPRMVCTRCGIVGADARPNWKGAAAAGAADWSAMAKDGLARALSANGCHSRRESSNLQVIDG
jgi:hypothetical protein